MDATEIRVRRPRGRPTRPDRYVSAKSKQNTVKALVITGHSGRLLFCGETRPGSTADISQARQAGLVDLLATIRPSNCSPTPATNHARGR